MPQFTDEESKIVGPLSLRQFLWFLGAGLSILFVQFFVEGLWLIVFAAVAISLAAACAYVRIQAQTLPQYLLNALVFFLNKKRYIFTPSDEQNK